MQKFLYLFLMTSCGAMINQKQTSLRGDQTSMRVPPISTQADVVGGKNPLIIPAVKPIADFNLSSGTGGSFGEKTFQFTSTIGTKFEGRTYANPNFSQAGLTLLVYIPSSSGSDFTWMFDSLKTLGDQSGALIATLRPIGKTFESLTADEVNSVHELIQKTFIDQFNVKLDNIRIVGSSQGAVFLTKSLLVGTIPYAHKVFGLAICDAESNSRAQPSSNVAGITFAVSDDDFTKSKILAAKDSFASAGLGIKNFVIPDQGHCRFDGKDLIGKFLRSEI